MTQPNPFDDARWSVPAAVATWLVPGLGHFLLGRRRHALILGVTIMALWFAGLLLGGISVFDRSLIGTNFVQFGQFGMAPSLLLQTVFNLLGHSPPTAYEPSFGRMQEHGILYTALAGMLNVLAILDVIYRSDPKPEAADADNSNAATDDAA